MSKKKYSKKYGQFFPLDYSMAKSKAFRNLSGAALKVFIEIRCEYNGSNNGSLNGGIRSLADKLHIGKTTVSKALKELEEKGFLFCTRRGHFHSRNAALYATTDQLYGKEVAARRTWKDWKKKPYKMKKAKAGDWPNRKKMVPNAGQGSPISSTQRENKKTSCSDSVTQKLARELSKIPNSGHYYMPYGEGAKGLPIREAIRRVPIKDSESEEEENRSRINRIPIKRIEP